MSFPMFWTNGSLLAGPSRPEVKHRSLDHAVQGSTDQIALKISQTAVGEIDKELLPPTSTTQFKYESPDHIGSTDQIPPPFSRTSTGENGKEPLSPAAAAPEVLAYSDAPVASTDPEVVAIAEQSRRSVGLQRGPHSGGDISNKSVDLQQAHSLAYSGAGRFWDPHKKVSAWRERLSVADHIRRRRSGTIEAEQQRPNELSLKDTYPKKPQDDPTIRPHYRSTVSLPADLGQGDLSSFPDLLLGTIEEHEGCTVIHDARALKHLHEQIEDLTLRIARRKRRIQTMDHLRQKEDEEEERLLQLIIASQTHQLRHGPLDNKAVKIPSPTDTPELDSVASNCQQQSHDALKAGPTGSATEKMPKFSGEYARNGSGLHISSKDAEMYRRIEIDLESNSATPSNVTSATTSGPRTSVTSAATLISLEDPDSHLQDEGHLDDSAQSRAMSPHWDDLRELQFSSSTTHEDSTSTKITEIAPEGRSPVRNQKSKIDQNQHATKTIPRKPVAKPAPGKDVSKENVQLKSTNNSNVSSASQSQILDRQPQRSQSVQAPIAMEDQGNNALNDSMFSDLSDLARVMGPGRSQGTPGGIRMSS